VTVLIATSVVRGSQQGESHGGVYLVDFSAERVYQVIDWNTMDIDWQGRGWDRGLRGIAFDGEEIYIAASDELFAYTPDFKLLDSWRNPYLRHCHEICRYERTLFLTSTGFDSILGFDLERKRFVWGLHITDGAIGLEARPFDPAGPSGPPAGNRLHLNNVACNRGGMHISGMRTGGMLQFDGRRIRRWVTLPEGVHNARPFRNGVLFNDTQADVVRFVGRDAQQAFRVPRYSQDQLTHTDLDDSRIARQAFGRGLCAIGDELIAAGSSPSTIALHDLGRRRTTKVVTLTFDVRNAIHGLEVWPYQ
jgi:hypothetical protein